MNYLTETFDDISISLGKCDDLLQETKYNEDYIFQGITINAVITDTPYNLGFHYSIYKDNLSPDAYFSWQKNILLLCANRMVNGGSILYLHYPEFASKIFHAVQNNLIALTPYEWITWIYHCHTSGSPLRKATRAWLWWIKNTPFATYFTEPLYIGKKACEGEYRNPNDKRIKKKIANGDKPVDYDWWNYEQVKNVSKEKTEHPCQLPLEMVKRLVEMSCPPGGAVLDPFTGSGTTAVACIETGRKFIGMEVDEKYYKIAKNRIIEAQKRKSLEL
jgi:site-specific DNA-methyltransferase (adenine-specific)